MNTRLIIASIASTVALTFSLTACADDNGVEEEAQLSRAASVSLADAITTAEQAQNGKAFEASIDDQRSGAVYEIGVAVGDQVFELEVNAESGEVTKTRQDNDDAPVTLGSSLNEIIRTAEQHQSGTAYEASCEEERGTVHCEVDVITDADESYEVVVDGTSGEVLSSTPDHND